LLQNGLYHFAIRLS